MTSIVSRNASDTPVGTVPGRFTPADCRIGDLAGLVDQVTDLADYPHATAVEQNVVVYRAASLLSASTTTTATTTETGRDAVQAELVRALTTGPGVVVVTGAFPDTTVVDRATAAFDGIIAAEKASGTGGNDHFAKAGANDRVWNALEKLAVADPRTFVDYYGNDVLALVCRAWLGPGYQMTSQVNVVRPGGQAQAPHRDYHLGFLPDAVAASYPAHVHLLSPVLTLQGAVAHCDMPLESGPTLYLPYSHQYAPGYLAWRRPEFRELFDQRRVQLPLAKGNAAFFNPALFHGAGGNVSAGVQRMANLLQVSSAFGRAMETVDRARTSRAVYPALQARKAAGADPTALANAIACAAEGYPFPTNLDLDENVDGLTPMSQATLLQQALDDGWGDDRLGAALDAYEGRHRTHTI